MTLTRWTGGAICAVAAVVTPLAASAPAPAGLDATLAGWDKDEHPDLRGVVVLHRGKRIAERYYNGATADDLHDIRSAGKSVTALMTGIALDQGAIRSLDDVVATYWPATKGTAIGGVSLRDVLTMRSGLAADDDIDGLPGNVDFMDESPDPLAFVLGVPASEAPGTRYRYNSTTAYVAGVVVAKASRMTMGDFARRHLFEPLGITRWRWDADAVGVTKGQGNLWLTTRGMGAIGEMVRGGGRANGRHIVGAGWVSAMLAPHVPIAESDPYADHYGYFWYRRAHRIGDMSVTVSFASGNGGNKIYVVPACGLVVAITSAAYGRGYGQRRSEAILKAILAVQVAAGTCDGSRPV